MQKRPPQLDVESARTLVKQRYGYDLDQIKELNSYDDRNYYIKTTDHKEFIMKLTNSYETNLPGFLDTINSLILHLYNNGLRVTVPQLNTNKQYLSYERFAATEDKDQTSEDVFALRLLEYIPGKILLHVPFTPELLVNCGQYLAKMDLALETFSSEVIKNRKFAWALMNASNVRQYLASVDSEEDRDLVSASLDQFQEQVINRLEIFYFSIIHGDLNEQNIIVESQDGKNYYVKGVIDFNDAVYAPRVFDLAIFLAYSMLGQFDAGPQILIPGFGLKGFLSVRSLTENELNILHVCIKARLCQSLVLGAHSFKLDPTNVYVLSSAKKGWPALRALHQYTSEQILKLWLDIDKSLENFLNNHSNS